MKPHRRKLGLALSGGGFRASLYHIGVLARLAELDLLRSVEVISCVSGGSIVGAVYYLHVKKLLESRPDREITGADFVAIVQRLEKEFLDGVQTNVRVRAFSNFWKNWKMFRRSYSRSDRLAELYDATFFAPVAGHPGVLMKELIIQPPKAPKPFHPDRHNRSRKTKVPKLILNATSLNTGRNWQFTAVDMGERMSGNEFVERGWFLTPLRYSSRQLPDEKYGRVPLGIAVASSACVPGVFHPLAMTGLYPDIVPELVDGGVYDNQGLVSILGDECTDVVISDASEQLQKLRRPGIGIISVVKRANGILMARVREQGLESLPLHADGGKLQTSTLVNMTKGIGPLLLAPGKSRDEAAERGNTTTPSGMATDVQKLLSEVRTDLDSFTDLEGYALMLDGYRIASASMEKELNRAFAGAAAARAGKRTGAPRWRFTVAEEIATGKNKDRGRLRQLRVAGKTFLKAYWLMPWLIPLGLLILVLSIAAPAALILLVWFLVFGGSLETLLWYGGVSAAVVLLSALVGLPFVRRLWTHNLVSYVVNASVALCGSLLAYLHLKWVDPLFLRRGKMTPAVFASSDVK